jgi:cytochrome c biogenesis protein
MSAVSGTQTKILRAPKTEARASESLLTRLMTLLSSVRFGVVLLCVLAAACVVGMLIMQTGVEGFDKYYAALTPSQRLLYGGLGLFDIYHVWYFNTVILVLSLNIVLSSIDHFPKTWTFFSRKKLDASEKWLRGQDCHDALTLAGGDAKSVALRVAAACHAVKLKPRVTEKNGKIFVFAERGAWNRLGAYVVHVSLLTIFTGGFLTAQFGHTGQMLLTPGASSSELTETSFKLDQPVQTSVALPFKVECTDIQQKLLDKGGAVSPMNTLDWLTRIRIKDGAREIEALVQLNKPFDYRGYRFFQASFVPEGKARNITLRVTPDAEGAQAEEVTIKRDGAATLRDGTRIDFIDFYPDFVLSGARADTQSPDYNNPAAALNITKPSGETARAYAFPASAAGAGPVVGRAVAGYKIQLADFEKVGAAHILSVQKDPGASVVYLGFVMLSLTLVGVFLFAHQRVWAIVEPREAGRFEIVFGGNTNRNKIGFEDRFKKIVKTVEAGS